MDGGHAQVVTSSKLHERGHFDPPNWQLLANEAKAYRCGHRERA
jgi:hypothetical protein